MEKDSFRKLPLSHTEAELFFWRVGRQDVGRFFSKWAQYDKGGRERRVVISKLCILLASGFSMLVCESFAERMMGTYLARPTSLRSVFPLALIL